MSDSPYINSFHRRVCSTKKVKFEDDKKMYKFHFLASKSYKLVLHLDIQINNLH